MCGSERTIGAVPHGGDKPVLSRRVGKQDLELVVDHFVMELLGIALKSVDQVAVNLIARADPEPRTVEIASLVVFVPDRLRPAIGET